MNPYSVADIVRLALMEDLGPGDLTTNLTVADDDRGRARIVARQELVLSGLDAAAATLRQIDPDTKFTRLAHDGDRLQAGDEVALLDGWARSILSAERVMLNFLMRMSGVATLTAKYVEAAGGDGRRSPVVDTRKTTPGLRVLEKAAVRHGGGQNHRFGLYDGILIKDNHIAAAGGIALAVDCARRKAPHVMRIEVEVDTLDQLHEALKAGADIIMLDNMGPELLRQALKIVSDFHAPGPRTTLLEASGGINLNTIGPIAQTGVDMISVGALTHSATSVDLGLDWD